MITSEQVRAARGLLRWDQSDLSDASGLSLPTVKRLEQLPGPLAAQARTVDAIVAAFSSAGVIFVEENGEGAGVRLKKKPPAIGEINEKIQALDEKIATIKVDGDPSPEIGMNRLKKALVQNERTKLKNRRAKIKKGEPK